MGTKSWFLFTTVQYLHCDNRGIVAHLGEFEQAILYAIIRSDNESYGLEISRIIEERTGRAVNPGAVYTALDRLERRGIVVSRMGTTTPSRGGRRKKFYTVQKTGAAALIKSRELLESMSSGLSETVTRLSESNA